VHAEAEGARFFAGIGIFKMADDPRRKGSSAGLICGFVCSLSTNGTTPFRAEKKIGHQD